MYTSLTHSLDTCTPHSLTHWTHVHLTHSLKEHTYTSLTHSLDTCTPHSLTGHMYTSLTHWTYVHLTNSLNTCTPHSLTRHMYTSLNHWTHVHLTQSLDTCTPHSSTEHKHAPLTMAPFISLKTTPLKINGESGLVKSSGSNRQPSCLVKQQNFFPLETLYHKLKCCRN